MHASAHTENILSNGVRSQYVADTIANIKFLLNRDIKVDAIAVKGTSGLVIGSIVSDRMNIPLVVVRKPGQTDYAAVLVESPFTEHTKFNYIIVDDLVASGKTIRSIKEKVGAIGGKWVGTYLYFDNNLTEPIEEAFYSVSDEGITKSSGQDTTFISSGRVEPFSPAYRVGTPFADDYDKYLQPKVKIEEWK